ncbi:MAG: transporter, partial [Gammaproteobacteria bacterium]
DTILTPGGARNNVVLPYGMQLGSGTYDFLPGITYNGQRKKIHWGAQYQGTIRTGSHKGYSLGQIHETTSWLTYQWVPSTCTSVRLSYKNEGKIDGIDGRISLPVQTADPDKYGGKTVNLQLGMNIAGQTGFVRGQRLALEASIPIYQDLNGPQMETDFAITVGWQYAW